MFIVCILLCIIKGPNVAVNTTIHE
jgi:hypothetical protein